MNLQRVMKSNVGTLMKLLRSKGLEGIAERVLRFRTLPMSENELTVGSSKMGGNSDLPMKTS